MEDLTKEERLAILSVASKTWNGQEPFEVFLGKMTQFIQEGIFIKSYTVTKTEKEDDTDGTEVNEGEA